MNVSINLCAELFGIILDNETVTNWVGKTKRLDVSDQLRKSGV